MCVSGRRSSLSNLFVEVDEWVDYLFVEVDEWVDLDEVLCDMG